MRSVVVLAELARAVIVLAVLLAACGSSSGGGDGGDGAAAAADHDAGGTSRDAAVDVPCDNGCVRGGTCIVGGCLDGTTCVAPDEQSNARCAGGAGGTCAPTKLSCSGMQGGCAQGEQLVDQVVCNAPSTTLRQCCPANQCIYGCRLCETCPL